MGDTKGGPFDAPGDAAREWLGRTANPNAAQRRRTHALGQRYGCNPPPGGQVDLWTSDRACPSRMRQSMKRRSGTSRNMSGRNDGKTGLRRSDGYGGGTSVRVQKSGGRWTDCSASLQRRPFPSPGYSSGSMRASARRITDSDAVQRARAERGTHHNRFGNPEWNSRMELPSRNVITYRSCFRVLPQTLSWPNCPGVYPKQEQRHGPSNGRSSLLLCGLNSRPLGTATTMS